MQRDIVHFATSKLQGGWSATEFGKYLTKENLQTLLPRFDRLEPLVRVRLLLAVLTLDSSTKQTLHAELQGLIAAAREDKEEWVSITAKALGSFEAPLDLHAVLAGNSIVRATVTEVESLLETGDSSDFRPLEEMYLSKSLVEAARGNSGAPQECSHFSHRDPNAGNVPELYRKASASAAAAAAASVQRGSTPASPAQVNAASSSRAAEGAVPPHNQTAAGQHQPSVSGLSGVLRQAPGVDDMFRSSRPVLAAANRQAAPSMSAPPERKGAARPVHVKLLDVDEVKKLSRQHASPDSSQAAMNGHAKHSAEEEEEAEERELEPGELPEEGEYAPSAKRHRSLHESNRHPS